MSRGKAFIVVGVVLAASLAAKLSMAQSDLSVTYGSSGIQTLSYKGTVLEDLGANASDAFHIFHMKMTDLQGNAASCAQCGWGENNNGRTWNAATQTWTYAFSWGSISVQFQQAGNTLNMTVTETNLANSGYVFDGASIYPFVLNFPQLPAGFVNTAYPQLAYETTAPGVTVADFGSGEVVAVDPDASKPLYSGFFPTGSNFAYTPLISGTTPDGLAAFLPHNDRPVQPGQTDSFTVSLRFAPSGTATSGLATDAYQNWAKTWPMQLQWTDRRAIGTVYLASSPAGSGNQPGGYPNNPRRYFNDGNSADFDVTNSAGLGKFQARILQQAVANVTNMKNLNAQGAITWDIEGEQYPQSTSYVCSPDQIAQVAPEMESIITDTSSPYVGMKLDDAYFKTMRDAGFRVGVCIRPQHFTVNADGTAQQVYLADSAVEAEMQGKMQFAHDRWGATLFYVDSTVDSTGAVLDAGIFQQLQAALPDSLIMPEESTPKHYAYTAPFLTFIDHGDTGTDPTVYNYYPKAFSANLVNDVDAGTLATALPKLTASVKSGDVLMAHVDYWQANDPTIVQIYANAGVGQAAVTTPTPTPTPTPVTTAASPVTITSPSSGAALSGAVTVTAQINASLDAAGSYLLVDGTEYGTARETQGPFIYPLDTTTLTNGKHTLQVWAHDTANNTDLSSTLTVTIANTAAATPTPTPTPTPVTTPTPTPTPTPVTTSSQVVITSPSSGSTLAGTVQVAAQVDVNLDAAGSYLMVDGTEIGTARIGQAPFNYPLDTTLLADGQHVIQIWAHDTGNNVDLSSALTVSVANGIATSTPVTTPSTTTPASTPSSSTATTSTTTPSSTAATSSTTTSTYPVTLTYPANGQGISGTVSVSATILGTLDAAGSYLMVDGIELGTQRVGSAPYLYALNTSTLTPGQHTLQVWAHNTNNAVLLSSPITVIVGQ